MIRSIGWAVVPCIAVLSFACGDDGSSGTGDDGSGGDNPTTSTTSTSTGTSEATIEDACAGRGNKDATCYQDPAFDEQACAATEGCFRKIYRDDAEQAMLDCFAGWDKDPDCNGDWCTEVVAKSLEAEAAHKAHVASCNAYEAACGGGAGDICRNTVVPLDSKLLAVIKPCLDGECAALDSCLSEAVGDFLASCGGETGGLW